LERAFFERDVVEVARALLGCLLVHEVAGVRRVGRIVETEAYLAEGDAAAHVAYGKKASVRALEAGPGTLYVHPMRQYVGMDIVARGGSVLVRGLEVVEGMVGPLDGPGKLTRALGVTRDYDGVDVVTAGRIWVEAGEVMGEIGVGPRVGITRDVGLELRFRVLRG